MPLVVPLEQERERGRGKEKKRGNQTSSPAVMKSMIPFRRKTSPPKVFTGDEHVEQDNSNANTKKKKDGKDNKDKDKEKGKPRARMSTPTTKRNPTKSAIDIFNSVSASMSTTYSASASQSQSASTSVPQSISSSSSVPPLPGSGAAVKVVPPSLLFSHSIPPLPSPRPHPQITTTTTTHSQSGSGSMFNTRPSSPDLIGSRKPTTHNTTRKKFAEAVSLALEEVTSRGRAVSGGNNGGAPFQPARKSKALTAYSTTSSSHSIIPFDEMEVLDISRLPCGDDEEEGLLEGGGEMKAVILASSGTVLSDEMEVLDIGLSGGGAEAEHQTEKKKAGDSTAGDGD